MIKMYKLEDGNLVVGSGKTLLKGFTEFTTSFDENGIEIFPAEMQPYLEAEAQQQEVATKISEAKQFLADTDYKVLPDYDKDSSDIIIERKKARETIRNLEQGSVDGN